MKRPEISVIKFTLFYTIYSFLLHNLPLFPKFYSTLAPVRISDYLFLGALFFIAFSLSFLFFIFLFQKYFTKFFAILLLMVSGFAFYFIFNYNIQIDEQMVENVIKTDSNEAIDLLSIKMFIYIFFISVLPAILVIFCKINHSKESFFKSIKIAFITLPLCFLLIISFYFKAAGFFRVNRGFEDLFTPFNYIMPLIVMAKNKVSPRNNIELKIEDLTIADSTQSLNVVLIVGETARKKNFSLYGYERETNPELGKRSDLQVIQNTVSCGTSTSVSIPCIFTPEKGYESYLNAINKAKVNVKWYDNNYGGCYGMCDEIPTFTSNHSKCEGSCPDEVIFNEFYKDFAEKKDGINLSILHQNGSHGPLYFKRYPKEFAKFEPECKTANINECSTESLINAYDNTIFYTDFLINQLIEVLQKSGKPSVVIYISDHGESLGENGIFLHGFPYSVAPREQKEIPFLVWASFGIEIKKQNEYKQKSAMNMVLKLIGANSQTINRSYDINL